MGKRIQVGQSIFLCHAISFVRLMNQKVVVQYTSPKSDSFKSDLRSTRTEFRERLICDAFPIKIFDYVGLYVGYSPNSDELSGPSDRGNRFFFA